MLSSNKEAKESISEQQYERVMNEAYSYSKNDDDLTFLEAIKILQKKLTEPMFTDARNELSDLLAEIGY